MKDLNKGVSNKVRDKVIHFYDFSKEGEDDIYIEELGSSKDFPKNNNLISILYKYVIIIAIKVQSYIRLGIYVTLIYIKGEDRKL